jgi:hypothetical protein
MTLAAPVTNSNQTATLPDATGTVMVSSNMPAFSAYMSANQTFSATTWTKVQLNSKSFDTNNNFDPTTNYRFTPTVAGYYQFNAFMNGSGTVYMSFYKNGFQTMQLANSLGLPNGAILLYMNGSTDYVELYLFCVTGQTISASANYNSMSGVLVRNA